MWILPKNFYLSSHFALDTAESKSVLKDHLRRSRSSRSLLWRSKPSPLPTWLRRWKRVYWLRLLSGRILKRSMRMPFEASLISSWLAIRANRSATPANGKEKKIRGTCGHGSGSISKHSSRPSVFLKTSLDTSASDSERSLPIWLSSDTGWTMMQKSLRSEYSARKNAVLPTDGKDSLSWPTANIPNGGRTSKKPLSRTGQTEDGKKRQVGLEHAVRHWPTPTAPGDHSVGKMEEWGGSQNPTRNWLTPSSEDCKQDRWTEQTYLDAVERGENPPTTSQRLRSQVKAFPTPAARDYRHPNAKSFKDRGGGSKGEQLNNFVAHCCRPAQENHSTGGKSRDSWPTPDCSDRRSANSKQQGLSNKAAETWTTPTTDDVSARKGKYAQGGTGLSAQAKGLLNANWVEQLMGLRVGWTQLPTEWIDSDSAETESIQTPQKKPSTPS